MRLELTNKGMYISHNETYQKTYAAVAANLNKDLFL